MKNFCSAKGPVKIEKTGREYLQTKSDIRLVSRTYKELTKLNS